MIKFLKIHRWYLLLIVLLGLFASKALLKPGFYTSHDGQHQLIRQYIFDRAVNSGHFPPRVDRQLLNNLGYPLFTFTYQLPFWLGEALIKMGAGIPDAVKGTFIITYIASGLAMYLFAQDRWGKLAATVAAFLYLWTPYRFLTMLVRAQLGEHTALIFIPLLLWAFNNKLITKPRLLIGSISIAGLILSHSMVAQMALLPFLLFWLARLFQERKSALSFTKRSFLVALLGLGLTAFYLVPAIYYRPFIQGLNRTFYAEHFVTLKQLFYSKWGYTFSVLGTNDGLSFQVGFAQWLAVLVSFTLISFSYFKTKLLKPLASAILLSFIAAIFLMTDKSAAFWRLAVQKFFIVDIPWRFLSITSFTAATLSAFTISQLKSKLSKTAFIFLLVFLALYTNRNHLRVNKYVNFDQGFFVNYKGTSNSYDEYQSIYTNPNLSKAENLAAFEIIQGQPEVAIIKSQPQSLLLQATGYEPFAITLNTVYFPGWQLKVNGQLQDIKKALPQGVPQVTLPAGSYRIDLEYQQTKVMKLANLVSLSTLAIILLCLKSSWLCRHIMPLKLSKKQSTTSPKN